MFKNGQTHRKNEEKYIFPKKYISLLNYVWCKNALMCQFQPQMIKFVIEDNNFIEIIIFPLFLFQYE